MPTFFAEVNAELAREPALVKTQVRRFVILLKELDADDGVLTRMRKLRRDALAARYKPLVEAMYDGHSSVSFDAEVRDEGARATTTHIDMHDSRRHELRSRVRQEGRLT